MLTYAFDLLHAIYEEEGYAPSEIPGLILKHNLYGVDIDPRAAQLASLALVLKAREKSRRFFQPGQLVRPQVIALQDVRFTESELREYVRTLDLGALFDQPVLELLRQFEDATTFGSLIQPVLGEQEIQQLRRRIEAKELGGELFLSETHQKVLRGLEQAEYLTQRYHVAVANPPYMGSAQMNAAMKAYVRAEFTEARGDLYSCFIQRARRLVLRTGFLGIITPPNWLFLSSFEDFRSTLLQENTFSSLVHIGRGVWGSDFGSVGFVLANSYVPGHSGTFLRLFERQGEVSTNAELESNFHNRNDYPAFHASSNEFSSIPGSPIAYWVTPKIRATFKERKIGQITIGEGKNVTSDNDRFIRRVWEVAASKVGRGRKWLLYAKGGPWRRWAGNLEYVVDWSDRARAFYRSDLVARLIPEQFWYLEGITWTDVTSIATGFRYLPANTTFDTTGITIFLREPSNLYQVLGLLNSRYGSVVLPILNPTLHVNLREVKSVPLPKRLPECSTVVHECVELATEDWNSFETSAEFCEHPLVRAGLKDSSLGSVGQLGRSNAAQPFGGCRNWRRRTTASGSKPTACSMSSPPRSPRIRSPSPAPTADRTWRRSSPTPSAA
jgi:hypothetical protein